MTENELDEISVTERAHDTISLGKLARQLDIEL
ncbi:UNVERIFIED_CONTAM: hypothetical protein DES50_102771 [Williamsia faeni]